MSLKPQGKTFRNLVKVEKPLHCVASINARHARLAKANGFKSLYIPGGNVAAYCSIPDPGITSTVTEHQAIIWHKKKYPLISTGFQPFLIT